MENSEWVKEWLSAQLELKPNDPPKREELAPDVIERLAFSIYRGQDFMDFKFKPKEFLVDAMIHRGDTVMVIGSPKSGKSLLIKQLICSLTSAHQFLGKYTVSEPTKVCYVQLEGEPIDTQDRLMRMEKSCPLVRENLSIYYSEPLFLQDKKEAHEFIKMIEMGKNHDVIVIDGLYLIFSGSLSDDTIVRQLIGNMRIIKNHFNCTLILVHHTHKVKFDQDGGVITEGDSAIFGSQFLRAWPDHIFHLNTQKNSDIRELKCSTQRSGMIETDIKLKLNQPDPLFFETLDEIPKGIVLEKWEKSIQSYLFSRPEKSAHAFEIKNAINIPKSSFYHVIGMMIKEKKVQHTGVGKSAIYRSLHDEK
jgi:hypothetical protein